MARAYCAPLKRAEVDTLILGCTHYPLVAPMLQRILGRDVRLVSGGHAVAAAVQRTLERAGLARGADGEGDYRFLCTGDVDSFRELGTRFLQMPLGEVERIEIPASHDASRAKNCHELARIVAPMRASGSASVLAHDDDNLHSRQYRIYSPRGKGDDLDSRRPARAARRPGARQSRDPQRLPAAAGRAGAGRRRRDRRRRLEAAARPCPSTLAATRRS